jgi:predicted transcriptional regulator
MKIKEIHSILGVAPATFFDWCKEDNKKNALAHLLKNLDVEEVLQILKREESTVAKPMMLLSTVNCSIGNKNKHFTLTSLKNLFYKKDDLSIYDKYALKTIKNEATQEELEDFKLYYKIPSTRIEKLLSA